MTLIDNINMVRESSTFPFHKPICLETVARRMPIFIEQFNCPFLHNAKSFNCSEDGLIQRLRQTYQRCDYIIVMLRLAKRRD